MARLPRSPRTAFTLVELLVVIGIIAVLVGILLPVLSGVQSRGRDLKCQSNIRTICQLVLLYAAENKGSLPYGHYYVRGASHVPPYNWGPIGGDERLVTVFSVLSRLTGKQYSGDDIFENPEAKQNNAPFLRCPEAEQVLPHLCSYVTQFTAFISPSDERRIVAYPAPIQERPAKLGDLLPFMALVHDTAVVPGMATDVGYVGDADIDEQRFWSPDIPQLRYYSIKDPYSRIPPGIRGNNARVAFPTSWRNIDPPPLGASGFNTYPYQGNLRFRHNKNTTCNVGFADGSVSRFTASFQGDGRIRTHDAQRKNFMIKWPSGSGIGPNPGFPN
jgi:prepilin-type N-terminal cleavage/methylation domain-containing protein/prepilin-type processing-associated H-X9-DG protein